MTNSILPGYDFIRNGNTGEVNAIDLETGEITEAVIHYSPKGSMVLTPKRLEAIRKRRELESKNARRIKANKPLGNFFFVPANEQFADLTPATVTRLVYLATFMGYDNILMKTQRTPMRRKHLEEILSISKSTMFRFWKKISPRYITENDDGILIASKSIFKRGNLKNIQHRKFYVNGIKRLYEESQQSNLKQIGYLLKLLPYINVEYNLLCYNPLETDIEKLELVSIAEFFKMIGYNITHLSDLLYIYRNIRFSVKDRCERFCTITYDGIDNNNARICINPRILYCGIDYELVEKLGGFCKL